jgi:hypothetical protein
MNICGQNAQKAMPRRWFLVPASDAPIFCGAYICFEQNVAQSEEPENP